MSHGGAELALIVFLPESNVTNNKETKETNAEQRNEWQQRTLLGHIARSVREKFRSNQVPAEKSASLELFLESLWVRREKGLGVDLKKLLLFDQWGCKFELKYDCDCSCQWGSRDVLADENCVIEIQEKDKF